MEARVEGAGLGREGRAGRLETEREPLEIETEDRLRLEEAERPW
ncbi:MAG: hypothetical protein QF903_07500 [Planctomycetota bacterium]|nr:hypothetical protein [Planctomycetota bacterium]MDP6761531.1 hypothetical protein [Planctomycetota bacterium]MDP6989311.1 hypothetical protein [Planctomycetota bacterium]